MKNKVIVFPTDTVYGIGAALYDKEGIDRIYKIKGRDFNKPLAVLCASIEQIESFAILSIKAKKIGNIYWPGGLTLILKTNNEYYNKTKEETIGVRIPNHPVALKILLENGPMKTTSVNNSNEPPLNEYSVINERYKNLVDKIYNNDLKLEEVSSTVIDLTTDEIKVLRQGNISKEEILKSL